MGAARMVQAVRLGALIGSPLGVVVVALGALGAWTCGYDAASDRTPVTAASTETDAHEPEPRSTPSAGRADVDPGIDGGTDEDTDAEGDAGLHAEPELRHDPDPDEVGLPIAIQDADGTSMDALHDALARAVRDEGQARLLFYGASHVASDLFTGPIRQELQSRFGDAGHGFVLPVHPWPRYRHLDVDIDSNHEHWETHRIYASSSEEDYDYYGLAGVAVETDERGAWGLVRTDDRGTIGRNAGLFDLFYMEQPRGGSFNVYIDGQRVERVSTRAEERGAGYAVYHVEDGPHELRIRTLGDGKVRIFGVAVERERPGVIVDTLGINGARAEYQLLWNDELYREHLKRRDPDLVTLAYGTNESGDKRPLEEYEADLRKVVGRVRETVPQASCLLVGPSDRPIKVEGKSDAGADAETLPAPAADTDGGLALRDRPRTHAINRIQREVAFDMGCGFFDVVAFQGGPLSMVDWVAHDPPYARDDYVHFTVRGYHRLADELLGALLEGFEPPQPNEALDAGAPVASRPATE